MALTVDKLQIEIGASSDSASQKIQQTTDSLRDLKRATNQQFKNPLKDMASDTGLNQAAKNVDKFAGALHALQISMKGISALKFPGISSFVKSLGRIAFYRAIRSAIKAVTKTISEGAENAYQYSKKYGDATKYIAQAYDTLASQNYKMGNQLGAAWSTLIATIQPILTQIISLVTRAAQVIAQFFALLGGHGTYLKAIDYTKEWGKATSGGAKAAKEWKNQLMGFDEINRLEEPSNGGGGGGGGAGDIGKMFDEAPLEAWTSKVKSIIDWCKEHMQLIKGLVAGIGAGLLGWKIASAFTDSLSKIFGFTMMIAGTTSYVIGWMDAWKNGPDWDNLALMIGGVTVAAIGAALAFGSVGAAITLLVGGVGMLVIGIKDWIKNGEMSTQTFWLMEAAIVAVGVGLSLLLGWIPLVVAGVAALGLAIYQNWDKIKELTSKTWNSIKETISTKFQEVKEDFELFKQACSQAWETVREKFDNIKKKVGEVVDKVKSFFKFEWKFPHINLPHIRYDLISVPVLGTIPNPKTLRIEWFANGGFPGEDGLFMANHNEMVGKFSNGRTAVANNKQITEGIATAVYNAFTSAMGSGSGSEDRTIIINLDGKQIAKTTTKYQRQIARAEA